MSDANPLQVYVEGEHSGELLKEGEEFIFNYSGGNAEHFVSLTMPVRAKGYVHPDLHPIFEMHLPEGYLLSVIKKHFSKLVATDDFGLLQLLAPSIEGRVRYAQRADQDDSPVTLDRLLHPESENLFGELVERFAMSSAVSGVQPKVLVQMQDKATLSLKHYIVKAWGDDYPQLALNEYYCMQVFKVAGVEVPKFYLSDDDRLFIMERFDVTKDGATLGFEDMCVLQGRQRDEKYSGSYEQVAKSIKTFVSPANKAKSLQQFFKMVVLNTWLQNGDAHLKNFGLVYESANAIRLAPAYDVVSTTAYIQNDMAALTLLGSKKWWGDAGLIQFGMESCELTRKQAEASVQQCESALQYVNQQLQERLSQESISEKRDVLQHLSGMISQVNH